MDIIIHITMGIYIYRHCAYIYMYNHVYKHIPIYNKLKVWVEHVGLTFGLTFEFLGYIIVNEFIKQLRMIS